MADVEETLKRIQSHKGVIGVVILSSGGLPIRSTFDADETSRYAGEISRLSISVRQSVRELDPSNDLTFFRIRSKKHEIMIAPDKDYILIVVQNPSIYE